MARKKHLLSLLVGLNLVAFTGNAVWTWQTAAENAKLQTLLAQWERDQRGNSANPGGVTSSQAQAHSLNFEIKSNRSIRFSDVNNPSSANAPVISGTTTDTVLTSMQQANAWANVQQKYAHFLTGLVLSAGDEEALSRLLIDRERVLNATTSSYFTDDLDVMASVDQHQQLLDGIDTEINQLLSAEDFQRYELFKDSGLEQYQLTRFETTLSGADTLQTHQAQTLLTAKLKHKHLFLEALADAHQLAAAGDKKAARFGLENAVQNYQRDYMAEAEMILTPEQYQKLADFETSEFEDIYLSLITAAE